MVAILLNLADVCYVYDPKASTSFRRFQHAAVKLAVPALSDPCGTIEPRNGTFYTGHWLLLDRSDNCTYNAQVTGSSSAENCQDIANPYYTPEFAFARTQPVGSPVSSQSIQKLEIGASDLLDGAIPLAPRLFGWVVICTCDSPPIPIQVYQAMHANGTGVIFANTQGHAWEAPRPPKDQPAWAVPVGETSARQAGDIRALSGKVGLNGDEDC